MQVDSLQVGEEGAVIACVTVSDVQGYATLKPRVSDGELDAWGYGYEWIDAELAALGRPAIENIIAAVAAEAEVFR